MKAFHMLKLGLVLAVFAAMACVMLAFVYTGTSEIIKQRQEADLQAILEDIFYDADSFEPVDGIVSPDAAVTIERAYKALQNGNLVGAALRLSRASYNGPIITMVGVSVDGTITGVRILEHSDTPGLGANAASDAYFVDRAKKITFYGQFTGKSVNDLFEVKRDVAVITASTITSRAVALSVKAAGIAANAWLKSLKVSPESGAELMPSSATGG
jgi:electron transport complex protein RnfG